MHQSPRRVLMIFSTIIFYGLALLPVHAQDAPQQTAELNENNAAATSENLAKALSRFTIMPPASAVPTKAAAVVPPPAAPSQGQLGNISDRIKDYSRNVPIRDNLVGINVGTKYVNGLFGGFAQAAGFGFGVEFTTADAIPEVELRARLFTSTRWYRKAELGAYFPSIGTEKLNAEVWFTYLRRTRDNFFGIGPRTSRIFETNFSTESRSYTGAVNYEATEQVTIGGYVNGVNAATFNGEDEEDRLFNTIFSGNPAVGPIVLFAPGFGVNTKIISTGFYGEADYRNDADGLTKGGFFYGRVGTADGLDRDRFGVDYGWNEVELDGRAYLPLGSSKTSFAARAYADLKSLRGDKQIPFYNQAFSGGRTHLRGFDNFRFRANNVLLFSAELRQTVWKQKEERGVDLVGFGDGGQVWGDNRSRVNPLILASDRFDSANWRFGVGGGVQYRYNKDFAVRLELGHVNERNHFYFSVSRGF